MNMKFSKREKVNFSKNLLRFTKIYHGKLEFTKEYHKSFPFTKMMA